MTEESPIRMISLAKLAENIFQCPMHPADQYDAFAKLYGDGMPVEDIAASFGISPRGLF